MADDEVWNGRLKRSVLAARDWEQRTPGLDAVAKHSSLEKDDAPLPGRPVHAAASYGLIAAVDHLGLVADLSSSPVKRPSSIFTVTRAALLGASQAVWVLSGTRAERRLRALSVASDERRMHRSYANGYARDSFIRRCAPDEAQELGDLAEKLTAEIRSLNELRLGTPYAGDYKSTTMMAEAAAHLASQPDMDDWLRLALGHEWRMASAAAHARAWPLHVRETHRESLSNGSEVRTLRSTLPEVAQAVGAATLMTNEAWRLWDLRRTRHI